MSMAMKYAMKKRMAKGGAVHEAGVHPDVSRPEAGGAARRGTSLAGEHVRGAAMAKEKGQETAHGARMAMAKRAHHKTLSEMESMRGQDRTNLAEGGEVACQACKSGVCMAHGGMVDRIMAKRRGVEEEPTADFESNDFDYMDEESPGSEADYTGADSGDEDDRDIVSRIMRSRAKRPA